MNANIAPLIYTPQFFDPAKAYQNYSPNWEAAMREGMEYARAHKLKTAKQLIAECIAHVAVYTDLQQDFRDNGRLAVKGADDVVLRACVRLINGIVTDHFSAIVFSLDGHGPRHRSFDYGYVDKDGNPLDLSKHGFAAMLTLVDEAGAWFKAMAFGPDGPYEIGLYRPIFDPEDAVEYWKHLQATGQGDIPVFVAHCVLGTDGVNLHPLFVETLAFAYGARMIEPMTIRKGQFKDTDSFGPLEPCRPKLTHPQGGFRMDVIEFLKQFNTIEHAGVAEDICEYWMKVQVMSKLKGTEHVRKLRYGTDLTAPIVPNAPHVQEFYDEARKAGVKFFTHDQLFEN